MNEKLVRQRARKLQAKELGDHFAVVNGAACILLKEAYHWSEDEIIKLAKMASDVWEEVDKSDDGVTILELCEKETGIEMTLDGKRSYHEFPYLDHKKWKGRRFPTLAEEYYIYQMERQWLPVMFIANICICLHRKYDWTFEQLEVFGKGINEMRKFNNNPKYYRKLLMQKYNIEVDA